MTSPIKPQNIPH